MCQRDLSEIVGANGIVSVIQQRKTTVGGSQAAIAMSSVFYMSSTCSATRSGGAQLLQFSVLGEWAHTTPYIL